MGLTSSSPRGLHPTQWSLDHGRWTVVVGPSWLDHGCWTMVVGPWSLDRGRWTVVVGPWLLDRGRWTVVVGLWLLDRGLWAIIGPSLGHCRTWTVVVRPALDMDCGSWTVVLRLLLDHRWTVAVEQQHAHMHCLDASWENR